MMTILHGPAIFYCSVCDTSCKQDNNAISFKGFANTRDNEYKGIWFCICGSCKVKLILNKE